MKFVDLKKNLETTVAPCYCCYGDDDFVLSRAVTLIERKAVEPKAFNIADKEFVSSRELIDELMQLPVSGDYRVVVARGKVDNAAIENYLKKPNPSTVLVTVTPIVRDSWNKASAPSLPSGATPVDCNRLEFKTIYAFVRKTAEHTGATIDERTVKVLADRCVRDMTRINSEAQKLALLRAGGAITEADVVEHVKADTEFVVYDLSKHILSGNTAAALAIVQSMVKNNDTVAAFTLLYNRFRRMFAAAVDPDGLSALGVTGYSAQKLIEESAAVSKARLKKTVDMLADADYAYKTGKTTNVDALTSFVIQAADGR